MKIKAVVFDLYGTLIDIHTDEGGEDVFRIIANFLGYQGVHRHSHSIREDYYRLMAEQRQAGGEKHAEFDAVALWRRYLDEAGVDLSAGQGARLPLTLAELYRAASRHRLELYPDVISVLDDLGSRFKLAMVSDAQDVWRRPEMSALGLEGRFRPVIVSSNLGYRKPDQRLFEAALAGSGAKADEALFVGNDMYRDIHGARRAGLKTVFFRSNQGRQEMEGVEPDYIIYRFAELLQAVDFFERQP